ncbi:sporulation protein YqfD [Vulcanibacillus modesticaldus]|uniref:Sporulation protein YqfD n=1 Tax=Vulcanibacillus modesticaldus TaxID=337097 RepID=A0A1D2YVN3_9BACI|nr:sporulation protein YqfD [Vulcanibacillus modesticaldus]OEF99723.1 sporulation protein YqfD [Vulcanibacillus modesticaldus]
MQKKINWLKGYVICRLSGKHIELFINQAIKEELNIWDVKMINDGSAIFSISLKDFFSLKQILKKTFTRIHIIKKIGLPFLMTKGLRRKGVLIGFILFLLIIYLFSSMIWTIEIEGNKTIKDEEIYQAINEIGIHRGMLKIKLPDKKVIQEQLQNKLEDTSWIGVKLKGTLLQITVIEKVKPDPKPLVGPRNIISTKNAVIYKILAETGLPQVKVNDRVKKGDILISGYIGEEEDKKVVAAEGEVLGIVWYQSRIIIPVKQKWRELTGNVFKRKYIMIGNRMIKIKGFGEIPYERYQQRYILKQLTFKNYKLPVGFIEENLLEYEERERFLSDTLAYKISMEQTKRDLYSKIKSDSKILSEKVLLKKKENGKFTLKVLFEVLEDITTTQPIILQPIDQGE